MWFKRLLAFAALAAVAVVIAIVAHDPSPVEPQADVTRTPTPTPKAKKRPRAAAPKVARGQRRGRAPDAGADPDVPRDLEGAGGGAERRAVGGPARASPTRCARCARPSTPAITLEQAWDGWKHGGPLPKHPVVISFDDGYLSHYTHAKPVLRALGWPGVLNLELKAIGPGGLTDAPDPLDDGRRLGGRLAHAHAPGSDDARRRRAAARAGRVAARSCASASACPADFFAYPAGKLRRPRRRRRREAAGYKAATTVDEGIARGRDDPFALKRVRVNGSDTAVTLLAKLGG